MSSKELMRDFIVQKIENSGIYLVNKISPHSIIFQEKPGPNANHKKTEIFLHLRKNHIDDYFIGTNNAIQQNRQIVNIFDMSIFPINGEQKLKGIEKNVLTMQMNCHQVSDLADVLLYFDGKNIAAYKMTPKKMKSGESSSIFIPTHGYDLNGGFRTEYANSRRIFCVLRNLD